MVERHDKNCGRYKAPVFLKRHKALKVEDDDIDGGLFPGRDAQHTLLNVVRSRGPGRIRDAVLIDNLEVMYYYICSQLLYMEFSHA